MASTVRKWGNGLGIRVPTAIAEQANLAEGTNVEFETTGGMLTLRPIRRRRPRPKHKLADLLARMKPQHRHGEMFGKPVGRELL